MRLKMVWVRRGGISSSQVSPYQKGGQHGKTRKSMISTHKPKCYLERTSKIKCSISARDGLDTILQAKAKRHSIQSIAAIPR